VAIVAENSPRWLVADIAVLAAGGIDVPRGAATPARELAAILAHAKCRFVLVDDPDVLARQREALGGADVVVLLHGETSGVHSWSDVVARGKSNVVLPRVAADEVATIVYTSGTTGTPKGVTLLHRNVMADVRALLGVLPIETGHVLLSMLPSWHMYERTVEYVVMSRGGSVAYTDLRRLRDDLVAERPHLLVGVPRVWDKIRDGVVRGIRERPWWTRRLGEAALAGSVAFTRARLTLARRTAESVDASPLLLLRGAAGLLAWPLHVVARATIHRRVRHATGGRVLAAVSGGAALSARVDLFFAATGIPLLVGYGLTETSPVIAVRRLGRNVVGTIGTPLDETEVRVVAEDGARVAPGATGTLRVRGPQVMRGYWENETATAAAIDPEGWFDTGDLVETTSRGDLVFRGRAKETIVLAGGENVAPEPIEQAIAAIADVEQVVVVGQDRKTLAALVWPRATAGMASDRGSIVAGLRSEILRRTGTAAGFAPWERVPRVALLPEPLSVEAGTMTATLKTRRAEVARSNAALIESLYGDERDA
jgi:long-chain acyl-CoA synthetase